MDLNKAKLDKWLLKTDLMTIKQNVKSPRMFF